jgi:acetyl esterase/lipase
MRPLRRTLALPLTLAALAMTEPLDAQAPMPFDALTARPFKAATARIAYADGASRFGDLYVPPGTGPFPVAVLLHGGCWRAEYDLAYFGHVAGVLAAEGIAVWSLEYRRVGEPGGGYPGTFTDVAAGIDHLRALAATHRLDLSRVVLVGHSAGGHLALWAADRVGGTALEGAAPLAVRGAVGLAAITDLAAYSAPSGCGASVPLLLGGEPDAQPARVAETSPVERRGIAPSVRLVVGTRDPIVPYAQAERFAASRPGRDVRFLPVEGAGHFELVAPWTSAWPIVRRAVRDVLGFP